MSKIIRIYNNEKYNKTKIQPSGVTKSTLFLTTYNHFKIVGPRKFTVGDIARVSKAKHVFEQGYSPNWITELFKIVKINSLVGFQ